MSYIDDNFDEFLIDDDDCCEHGIGFDEVCEDCMDEFDGDDWRDFFDEDDEP